MTSTLIDRFLPSYSLRQVDHAPVAAGSELAWPFVRGIDFYQVGLARLLFAVRLLPETFGARLRGRPSPLAPSAHIDDFTRPGMGFQVLAEEPGREIVVGAVGRVWQPQIQFATVTPEAFSAFDEPGFGKIAWSLAVEPRESGGTWITFDLRVGFTDRGAEARFRPYWALIGQFSHALRRGFLRLCQRKLGTVPDRARPLPGDELLAGARVQRTHAANIEAPVKQVWPWLLQIGADRAGWYSWDRLDNAGLPSAERIVPELQHLEVGQIIHGLPKAQGGFAVLRIDAGRVLVLGSPSLLPGGAPEGLPPEPPYQMTWAFVLEPIGERATHLTVRVRGSYEPSAKLAILLPALLTAHEVMQRRQLQNLKRRAERSPGFARRNNDGDVTTRV
jgi:hypothetical protein